jgi:chromosome segregation ATPase
VESLKDRLGESSSVRSAAEATVVQLRSQLETLQRRCEELTTDYEEAQDGNRTASESITRLRADLDAAEKRVAQGTTDLADLNEKYSEVVEIVENNKSDLEEAHSVITDLQSKIAGIEEQESGTAHTLQNALQNQEELEATLESERKERLQEITALREKTNGLEKDILSVKQEKDKLQGQVRSLEGIQAQYVEKENTIMERARRGLLVSVRPTSVLLRRVEAHD